MRDLNQNRWSNNATIGWDSVQEFMRHITSWERDNKDSMNRVNNGTNYAWDIPYIVRGQNYIRIFSNMIDSLLAGE